MTSGQESRAPRGDERAGASRRPAAARKPRKLLPLRVDNRRTRGRLIILALVCLNFFFLWLALKVFAQADFWPLLVAPILVSAWFFYEVGAVATIIVTGILLVQTSFEKNSAILIAVTTFGVMGVGLGWGQRRQRRLHRHVLRSSLTDSLTGLYNFGSFMECFDREMRRVDRYGGAVTLVMFDIDHFKMFNDRFGHQAGNEALKIVAATLRKQKRESDIVARFGGEEFVLLFPGKEASGVETARRMRKAISQIRVPVGGGATTEITVSAGVACYPNGAASKEELLDKVDQLLYASKRKGRNRVSVAPRRRRLAAS
ncbi:MAG: GGDEF domain-containing protein [Thermoleophilia bacterium]